jgi:hypothetical protein
MKMLLPIVAYASFLLSTSLVYAAPTKKLSTDVLPKPKINEESRKPFGCRDAGYIFDFKTLQLQPEVVGHRQSLYFILNTKSQPVNLWQMQNEDTSRTLFLNNTINPSQWAVLSTGQKAMQYICTIADKNLPKGRIVDCANSLQICEFVNVVYGLNNRGDYWLVRNSNRAGAVNSVIHYGIIPK